MIWKFLGTVVLGLLGLAFTSPRKPPIEDDTYERQEKINNEQKKNNCAIKDLLYEQNERNMRNEKINNCKKEDF